MDPNDPKTRIKMKYMKQQRENIRLRKGSRWIGLALGGTALSIYFYSMYMVKQETILREIDDEIQKA